jgi:hypothetical protein
MQYIATVTFTVIPGQVVNTDMAAVAILHHTLIDICINAEETYFATTDEGME